MYPSTRAESKQISCNFRGKTYHFQDYTISFYKKPGRNKVSYKKKCTHHFGRDLGTEQMPSAFSSAMQMILLYNGRESMISLLILQSTNMSAPSYLTILLTDPNNIRRSLLSSCSKPTRSLYLQRHDLQKVVERWMRFHVSPTGIVHCLGAIICPRVKKQLLMISPLLSSSPPLPPSSSHHHYYHYHCHKLTFPCLDHK